MHEGTLIILQSVCAAHDIKLSLNRRMDDYNVKHFSSYDDEPFYRVGENALEIYMDLFLSRMNEIVGEG